jgi:hypothetical protein
MSGVVKLSGPVAYTWAIQSVQEKHGYRPVDIEELGFEYSIVGAARRKERPTIRPVERGYFHNLSPATNREA